jgi:glyoxylase I family protein
MRVRVKLGSDRVGGGAASRCARRPSMFCGEPIRVESRPSRRKGLGPLQSGSVGRPNVRRANNLKLRGGGLHHVAIAASDFERSLRFYTEGLGFRNVLTFPEEGQTVAMLDTGDATYVELFSGGSGKRPSGSILHLALRTSDCDKATERARTAGGTITQEPTDVVLEGDPPVPVRYSFCEGPDGEQIELFQAEGL